MQRMFPRMITLAFVVMLSATACSKATPTASGGSPSTSPPSATDTSSGGGGRYGGGGGSSSSGGATIPIGDDNANDHGKTDVSGMSSVKVEQKNDSSFYFEPTVLMGTAGQQLTVQLENGGTVPHTFTIDAQNINVTLQPGAQQDVQVTFANSGAVEFYCQFHHTMGMAGELLVG